MDHIAIMRKSWGLTQKILTGEKKIESRWYKSKYKPWDGVAKGDIVYFKDSGYPVCLKARVAKVLQFFNLNPKKVKEILIKFGKDDGINANEIHKYYEMFMEKKYCILVFLKSVQKIKPFNINKKGFGAMASWIRIDDINEIKL